MGISTDLEYRHLAERPEFRSLDNGRRLIARGYAALYNVRSKDLGGYVEIVTPSAFKKTLAEGDQLAYVDHDPKQYLARRSAGSLSLESDATGLGYEIVIPDTTVGRDFATLAESGDTSGVSFGFRTHRRSQRLEVVDGVSVRHLIDVGLHHISPLVSHPAAYDGPSVALAMRSLAATLDVDVSAFETRSLADIIQQIDTDDDINDTPAPPTHAGRVRRRRR